MPDPILFVVIVVAIMLLMGGAMVFAVLRGMVRPEHNQALVVITPSQSLVSFTNRFVMPGIHRVERIDLSVHTVTIRRRGKDGLICADNIRADIDMTCFVCVNRTEEDILRVASKIGCARATSQDTLEELFSAKFSEALKTVGKSFDFREIFELRDKFRDEVIKNIGRDLNGYVLDDIAIDCLEQTPLEHLDPNNILDAQGIKKITAETAIAREAEAELKRAHEAKLGALELEARQATLLYEREIAEAEARQAFALAQSKAENDAQVALINLQAEHKVALERARLAQELPPIPNDVRVALGALEARIAALEASARPAPHTTPPSPDPRDNDAAATSDDADADDPATATSAAGDSVEDARQAALRALGLSDSDAS